MADLGLRFVDGEARYSPEVFKDVKDLIELLEVLLLKLFASKTITPWTSKKNLQTMAEGYADDLTLLLKSLGYKEDLKQLNEILDILEHFRRISGLTINKSKTQICHG